MNLAARPDSDNYSIVALDKFIQATRDSGYKGTASAVAELVDNSIQAGASRISIGMMASADAQNDRGAIEVSILDNGSGMDPFTVRHALRFGGSTRFGDRTGLGRYGMGLPNASLSQARRVTVYTWQAPPSRRSAEGPRPRGTAPDRVYMSYLDVDQIVSRELTDVPRPELIRTPPTECVGPSGTLVIWTQCDRLDNRRVSTLARKLEADLGRRFRHYLWKGLRIAINGDPVRSIDPLYLNPKAQVCGAEPFGDELRYEVHANSDGTGKTGWVSVRFSELPVHRWHDLPNEEKRRIGIAKGAGVSIVRAGREVDYGWFFMGSKHRENYDDWWRCEIQFDPVLDEAFGITHTKQQVRPTAHLLEALTPDLEATARALNVRVRRAHFEVKAAERFSEAARVASERDHLLRPLPPKADSQARALVKELESRHPILLNKGDGSCKYSIVEDAVSDTAFFTYGYDGDRLILVLNTDHPFYREVYKPLLEGDTPRDHQLRAKVELLLLSAARAEAAAGRLAATLSQHRLEWSHTLAAFFSGK